MTHQKITDSIRKWGAGEILSFFSLNGFICFILFKFYPLFSILSVLSFTIFFIIIILIYFRKYKISFLFILMFLSIISGSILATKIVIISDSLTPKYRSTNIGSFIELPKSLISKEAINLWWSDENLIEVTECNQQKIAKLPLLPYPIIHLTPPNSKKVPFGFRRLPYAKFKSITLDVFVSAPTNNIKKGDYLSFGIEFGSKGNKKVLIQEIFPRNISCHFSDIVGIPVLEFLPWDSKNIEAFFAAYSLSLKLKRAYVKKAFSPKLVKEIYNQKDTGKYKKIFDFVALQLAIKMLDGNMLAELKADIINSSCVILSSSPSLFDGPLETLKNHFYTNIVGNLGTDYNNFFEACAIPEKIVKKLTVKSTLKHITPNLIQEYSECLNKKSESQNYYSCLEKTIKRLNNEDKNIIKSPNSEEILQLYEKDYSKYVIDRDNKLLLLSDIRDCPKLRDKLEYRILQNSVYRRNYNIIFSDKICTNFSDQNLQSKISELRSVWACKAKNGFAQKDSAKIVDKQIEFIRKFRCQKTVSSLKKTILQSSISINFNILNNIRLSIEKLSFVLKENLVSEFSESIKQIQKTFQMYCKGKLDFMICVKDLIELSEKENSLDENENLLARIIHSTQKSGMFKGIKITKKTEPKHLMEAAENKILQIALCNLLGYKIFSESFQLSRKGYCLKRGLAHFMRKTTPSIQKYIQRIRNPEKNNDLYYNEMFYERSFYSLF